MRGFLTLQQVTAMFKIHDDTIRREVECGNLAAIKSGGVYRIHPTEIEAYKEAALQRVGQSDKGIMKVRLAGAGPKVRVFGRFNPQELLSSPMAADLRACGLRPPLS